MFQTRSGKLIVSAMKVAKLMSKGYSVFLACVVASTEANQSSLLEEIRIVHDFPDVFPKDLPGLPLVRELSSPLIYYLEQYQYLRPLIEWH